MRKIIKIVYIGVLLLLNNSCEENEFSPKTEFKEIYSLNCIINADSLKQYATILKSFDLDGLDPNVYTENPFVSNAQIKLIYNDNEYSFEEKIDPVQDGSKFKFPTSYYSIDNLVIENNRKLAISAELPDGNILKAETELPAKNTLLIFLQSAKLSNPGTGNFIFRWKYSHKEGIAFLPNLYILYTLLTEGDSILHKFEIPKFFDNGNAIYPEFTNLDFIVYNNAAFDSSFALISQGDNNKSKYRIIGITFELNVLDKNLTAYYASVHRPSEGFAVILNEIEFTNIENGRGVFGSFISKKYNVNVDKHYVQSLGYRIK